MKRRNMREARRCNGGALPKLPSSRGQDAALRRRGRRFESCWEHGACLTGWVAACKAAGRVRIPVRFEGPVAQGTVASAS